MNPNTLRKIKRLEAGESFITSEPGNSMLPLYMRSIGLLQ